MALTLTSALRKDIAQPTTAKWQHAHFADIAAMIRTAPLTGTAQRAMAEHAADKLASSNPKFDRTRFLAACIPVNHPAA